jgi:hypothetical protein
MLLIVLDSMVTRKLSLLLVFEFKKRTYFFKKRNVCKFHNFDETFSIGIQTGLEINLYQTRTIFQFVRV